MRDVSALLSLELVNGLSSGRLFQKIHSEGELREELRGYGGGAGKPV